MRPNNIERRVQEAGAALAAAFLSWYPVVSASCHHQINFGGVLAQKQVLVETSTRIISRPTATAGL
ncbi:Uncharacterised protein [Mycobacteroides abscessus subsp. massiliense]|nr:Uncharacterised protein [Mycobacteroides abscessus subsp. massiliense]SKD90538.1 Uncharacterised protein [Mycobacteroides abscessus subsp. massiliense]SKE02967.1 Uncharacterised protein [Mycobacteroides abscessus subsp. massiliense]SKE07059.1 Uncharacterised protein [Mycobacteroides abscessus subsp. massiliense]SKE21573.1 Uncharacterised protein [Mycobacteroides abscessus subsp. massiliense]